jgi:apolipoprotein N-acyltransferase
MNKGLDLVMTLGKRITGLHGWRAHLLAFFAGAAGVLGQAPFHLWPITLLSIMVLVWLLDGAFNHVRPLRTGGMRAFSFAYGQFFAGLYWLGAAFISRGPEYIWLMPFALAALMAGLALIWALAGVMAVRFWTDDHRRIAVFALAFYGAEWVRGNFLTGFPWNLPGMVWVPGGAVSQSVSLFGIWGLSLLTLFAFAAPAALTTKGLIWWRRALPVTISIFGFAALWGFGAGRLAGAENGEQPGVRLRVVQAYIDQRNKWKPENRAVVLEHYLRLSTASPLNKVSHVIWPEGALPTLLLEDGPALDAITAAFNNGPVLMTGITRRERGPMGKTLYRNSLIALSFTNGQPKVETVYDKHHLVPFGEYMPLADQFSKIGVKGLINFDDGFTPGPAPSSMKIDALPAFSPQICYEIAYSGFTPEDEGRPDWILNISNDAWFGPTTGPYQHLDQARFRAIEEGLPVVRSVSSGIAGVVDPYGRMRMRLGRKADRAVDTVLPLPLPATPYNRHGLLILLILAGAIFSFRLLRH